MDWSFWLVLHTLHVCVCVLCWDYFLVFSPISPTGIRMVALERHRNSNLFEYQSEVHYVVPLHKYRIVCRNHLLNMCIQKAMRRSKDLWARGKMKEDCGGGSNITLLQLTQVFQFMWCELRLFNTISHSTTKHNGLQSRFLCFTWLKIDSNVYVYVHWAVTLSEAV